MPMEIINALNGLQTKCVYLSEDLLVTITHLSDKVWLKCSQFC